MSDTLLAAVKARQQKNTPFNYGILTADRYVQTVQEAVGNTYWRRLVGHGKASYADLIEKASRTLVYSNPEMVLEQVEYSKRLAGSTPKVELPKNTLMAFRHVLTSSTKDRDGDTLHSDGAEVDTKMLLLWQHVHTLPIGKMVTVNDKNVNKLIVTSAIVDMNQLCHDAAVMVDNGMGRFSHGFKALEFTEQKAGKEGEGGGFDVTKYEIMEESLVSVPANPDAECEEVLLSLVEGGKLTSPLMKRFGRSIREHRNILVPGVRIKYRERLDDKVKEIECNSFDDLKAAADAGLIGEVKHEDEPGSGGEAGAGTNGAGAPKEADADVPEVKKEEVADNAKVTCPHCGEEVMADEDGNCPKCGEPIASEDEEEEKAAVELEEDKAVDWVGAKPYPSEHAARLSDPGDYEKIRRQNNKLGEGIHAIFGITKEGKAELQSIHFDYSKFTAEEAKKWLAENKYKPIEFEAATGDEEPEEKAIKAGRVLSAANEKKLRDAVDDVDEAAGMEGVPRPCSAMLQRASRSMTSVLDQLGGEGVFGGKPTVKDAMVTFLSDAGPEDRERLLEVLKAMACCDRQNAITKQYRALVGITENAS